MCVYPLLVHIQQFSAFQGPGLSDRKSHLLLIVKTVDGPPCSDGVVMVSAHFNIALCESHRSMWSKPIEVPDQTIRRMYLQECAESICYFDIYLVKLG